MDLYFTRDGAIPRRVVFDELSQALEYPVFADKPCETKSMRTERWLNERHILADKQHAFVASRLIRYLVAAELDRMTLDKIRSRMCHIFEDLIASHYLDTAIVCVTEDKVVLDYKFSGGTSHTLVVYKKWL